MIVLGSKRAITGLVIVYEQAQVKYWVPFVLLLGWYLSLENSPPGNKHQTMSIAVLPDPDYKPWTSHTSSSLPRRGRTAIHRCTSYIGRPLLTMRRNDHFYTSTWLIASELANQRARKALFTVWYTLIYLVSPN